MSVIKQKGESQNSGNKKAKFTKFQKNEYLLPSECACQGIRNVWFSRASKIWHTLLSCYFRFEIRPFALTYFLHEYVLKEK